MSLKHNRNVPKLVKFYKEKYPTLDRDLLRRLIRLENKIENPSELKKLDRHLKQAFGNKADPSNLKETPKPSNFGLFKWLDQRAARKRHDQNEMQKTALLRRIQYLELLAENTPAFEVFKKVAEKDRELLKLLEQNEKTEVSLP
jgi:hypothetical protein